MQIHPVGYRTSGFYHIARTGQMNNRAQHRLNAPRFWEDRGIVGANPHRSQSQPGGDNPPATAPAQPSNAHTDR